MGIPSWLRWYKKPTYRDVNDFAKELSERAGSASHPNSPRASFEAKRRTSNDVPRKLRLERILQNRTCSPMSLYDFYMYLKYIEHSSENLEFYVWFKNYEAGRLTAQPEDQSHSYTSDGHIYTGSESSLTANQEKNNDVVITIDGDGSNPFEEDAEELYARISGFINPITGCGSRGGCGVGSPVCKKPVRNIGKLKTPDSSSSPPSEETISAQKAELKIIKNLFLVPGSPKELNIPAPMRKKALDAIQNSTDAKNLEAIAEHCFLLLKSCSHRNFIRLGVSNGTFETLCVATTLGIVLTFVGVLYLLCISLINFRHESRWKGIGAWPLLSFGIGLCLAGVRGTCFFLLLFLRRQALPWERFADDQGSGGKAVAARKRNPIIKWMSKVMIFDRKMKIKDNGLRRLQRKIVLQSLLGGMIAATLICVLFLAVPIWRPL